MSRQDDVAAKAVRRATLKSLKEKKKMRIRQIKEDCEKTIRDVNIQYDEDPERLKAKYAAADYAKSEKARAKAEKKIEQEKISIENEKKRRRFSLGEEIGSSIVQGIGVCLFIAATAILDTLAIRGATSYISLTMVLYSLFGASMILMYLFSVLRHSLTHPGAKEVFNRLAHVSTFFIIGFGYTAYTLTKIQGTLGWVLFGIVWGISIVGAILYAVFGSRSEKMSFAFYLVLGISGLLLCRYLYGVLSAESFRMLVLAGIFYIVALVFYSLRKIKYMHLVSNCLMLIGSIYMFFSLFFINR